MIKGIDKMIDNFVEETEGLVAEGVTSQEVGEGTYELHMKPLHKGEAGGINIFSSKELSLFFYKWLTPDEISSMIERQEFPMNIRSVYKDEKGAYLLNESQRYLMELPSEKDIEDIITYDRELIEEFGG